MQWIVFVVIIVIAVVSAIANAVKNQQDKEPPPRRRPPRRESGEGVRTGSSDMDRFLQEIEKLRKRNAGDGDEPRKSARGTRPKAVPTVAPVKRPKRSDAPPAVPPSRRVERLPAATVLPSPPAFEPEPSPITRSAPQPTDAPAVSRTPRPEPKTAFGKDLLALLANKQSLPVAVVLQEILGPPKCRQ